MPAGDPEALFRAARDGDRRALGRLLSLVEAGGEPARALGRLTFAPSAGVELVVGVTGAPGAGKSTLTDGLIGQVRASSRRVGVLAVDPSSPWSGGAVLGDRVRMGGHAGDADVWIRSVASRGHLGGLALAVPEMVRALAAVGFPVVLVETVGVGQAEIEVASAADTTVVVVTPGWGDDVQAEKAGLLEAGDIFVVNKADRPGAAATRRDLEAMLDLGWRGAGAGGSEAGSWRPAVVTTSATSGEGVTELWATIEAHRRHLVETGLLGRRRDAQAVAEMGRVVAKRLERDVAGLLAGEPGREAAARLRERRVDPYEAADGLLAAVGLRASAAGE